MVHLLIINDNSFKPGIQNVNGIDFDVILADSPLQAFNQIIHISPDAIAINMAEKGMDTVKVYHRIRNMQASKDVPILMFIDIEEELNIRPMLASDPKATYFTLPVTQYETFDWVIKTLEVAPPSGQKTIMVVDDDPVILDLTKLYIGAKYQVVPVNSASEAIDRLATEVPDMIILDIAMPERDGKELFKDIRAVKGCGEVPIVFQTGMAGINTVKECLALGAAGFVLKPIQKTVLLDKIEEVFTAVHQKKKLFIIEEFDFMYSLIAGYVKNDYEVARGESVLQSLNHIEEAEPDIILIDIDNSSFVLNRTREKSNELHVPMVLMTRNMTSDLVMKEKQKLNTSFVALPLVRENLLDTLNGVGEWRKPR